MKKLFGIIALLLFLWIFLAINTYDSRENVSTFLKPGNIENLLSRTAMYGLLGIGVALVIIHSGIDLSIGSVVCLTGVLLALFLDVSYVPPESVSVVDVLEVPGELSASGSADAPLTNNDSDTAVQNSVSRLKVPRNHFSLKEGMVVRYDAGRRGQKLLLTVAEIITEGEYHLITVDKQLEPIDIPAQITNTVPVVDFSRESKVEFEVEVDGEIEVKKNEKPATLTLLGEHSSLRPRDKVRVADSTGSSSDCRIDAIDTQQGNTVLTLADDLPSTISTEWRVVILKRRPRMPIPIAILAVLAIGILLGTAHGLLVTVMKLQPFVVTLCGLLIYRGIAQWLGGNEAVGFKTEYTDTLSPIALGKLQITDTFGIPYPLFIFIAVAIIAAVFLNQTIWGRYLLALGKNEEAARYSGINTSRIVVLAYVICGGLASVGGMLFALNANSVSPSNFGNFFELYAIAAAVLGGCSLRGGEGSILGVVLGTLLMQTLYNMINLMGYSDELQNAIIGMVILIGVIADEAFKRMSAKRRAIAQAKALEGKSANQ